MKYVSALLLATASLQAQGVTLEELEKLALANYPSIHQAQAGVRSAEGRLKQAGLYPNPTVGYSGEQIRGGAQHGGEQGFFVGQTVVMGGKLSAAKREADQLRQQASISVEAQRLRVLSNVRTLYYQGLAAQRLVELRRSLARLAKDALETASQLGNIGQADRPDILQAEVEAGQADLATLTAEQQRDSQWHMLAIATGQPETTFLRLEGDLEKLPTIDLEASQRAILENSPALKYARKDVDRAQASLLIARKASIPDLQVKGGLQQNFELLGLGGGAVGLQGFAEIGVQIPIFNRNQGGVASARADVARATQEINREQLELQSRLTSLFTTYAISRQMAERYGRDMLPRARKAYEMYRANYQTMAVAYPQVLVAQRTYFQLQVDYIQALERAWRGVVAIQTYLAADSSMDIQTP